MTRDIKVFYGIHGGIISGVYGTLESCIASRGDYHEFDNFYDARFFACTGSLPETKQVTMNKYAGNEIDPKKLHFESGDSIDEEGKKKDSEGMKEEVVLVLRRVADSLEKEDHIDKIDEGIKALSDKLSSCKVENTSAGDKMSRLHKISVEIEDLISLMRQRLNISRN